MRQRFRGVLLAGFLLLPGCATSIDAGGREAAAPAIKALQDGRFEEAGRLATADRNAYARLVRAVVRYKKAGHQLTMDARTMVVGVAAGGVNQKYLTSTFETAESELGAVEDDLAFAAQDPDLAVELCVACWEIDWNGDGRIDERDRRLFQIEQDAEGKPIPEDDPRRKPTFRFDVGDVAWARAFVGFQRAAIDLVLAYDWSEAGTLVADGPRGREKVVIHLVHPERVAEARRRILEALGRSDEARRSYLAETDDDREWVPNPRQKSHPMPLPVDQKLYDTWEGVLGDLRRLVRGDEGLSVAEVAALDREASRAPVAHGFLDVGGMLAHPHDITFDVEKLRKLERSHDADALLGALFGDRYVASMKPSPLPKRLARMMGEVDRREETFERKLRYLFWLN